MLSRKLQGVCERAVVGKATHMPNIPDHNLISRFWMPIMKDGVIRFESPDSPLLDRHIVRHGLNVKEFNLGKNVTSVEEE